MKKALLVLMGMVLASPLHAADLVGKVKGMQVVKNLFGDQVKVLEAKDLGNLYEVVASVPGRDKQIVYVTKDGTYLITGGNLINKEKVNLTKDRYDEVNKVDVSKLPIKDAITITKGSGAKKLYMFTDVDCPYCKKAWAWLKTQTDYTMYVFLFPLDMHPNAAEKSIKILCDTNPAAAFDLADADQPLTADKCETGEKLLQKQKAAGTEVGVSGTPLIITGAGMKMSGFNQKALETYLKGPDSK
jgi:thiol:disulfide interchange protein DsbC